MHGSGWTFLTVAQWQKGQTHRLLRLPALWQEGPHFSWALSWIYIIPWVQAQQHEREIGSKEETFHQGSRPSSLSCSLPSFLHSFLASSPFYFYPSPFFLCLSVSVFLCFFLLLFQPTSLTTAVACVKLLEQLWNIKFHRISHWRPCILHMAPKGCWILFYVLFTTKAYGEHFVSVSSSCHIKETII